MMPSGPHAASFKSPEYSVDDDLDESLTDEDEIRS